MLFLTWPPVRAVPAVNVKSPEATDVVTVAQGNLQGVYNADKSVEVYTGIPYAEPPVGALPQWEQNKHSDSLMYFGDTTGMISEKEHALFAVLDQQDRWK